MPKFAGFSRCRQQEGVKALLEQVENATVRMTIAGHVTYTKDEAARDCDALNGEPKED